MTRGGKIGLAVGCLPAMMLLGIGSAILGIEWVILIPIHLAAGWAIHLSTIIPKVTLSWTGIGFFAICAVLAVFIGHRFCRWLWQGSGHSEAWQLRWTLSGFGILLLMFGAGMTITAVAHQTGWLIRSPEPFVKSSGSNDRSASTSLKTISSAQADFRANDRDNNKVNDYWRGDIAGLYTLKVEGYAIKLIELSVASADDRPIGDISNYAERHPKAGYWFRALRYKDETDKVDAESRWAACAYPSSVGAGAYMFLVNEENIIYRKLFEGEPPAFCPAEPLKDGWDKLD